MAHGITKSDTMFSVGHTPWHSLGKVLPHDSNLTVEQGLQLASMDWTVRLEEAWTADGQLIPAMGVVREDTGRVIAAVGKGWSPLQNRQAFEWFQRWLDTGAVRLETAGTLFGGKRVWILAKIMKNPIVVGKDDAIEKFILLAHAHDGSLAIRAGLTAIRVVCNNTLSWALDAGAARLVKILHRGNAGQKLEEVADTLDALDERLNHSSEVFGALAAAQVGSEREVISYLAGVYKQSEEQIKNGRRLEKIANLFNGQGHGSDLKTARGTYWGLYNALTEYETHISGRSPESRLNSIGFGDGANKVKRGLDVAFVMATKQISLEDVFESDSEVLHKVGEQFAA